MPPRYAYWTILVDNQPTAFRAGAQDELMPTFKRLKEKHPSAVMMWFQNGKLWNSRLDAQEAMRARGEMGRRGDERQGGFRGRDRDAAKTRPAGPPRERTERRERREWTPKSAPTDAPKSPRTEKLDWKPKGEFTPAPKRSERPDWKPKSARSDSRESGRTEWKPKSARSDSRESGRTEWKPKSARPDSRESGRTEWKPKSARPYSRESGRTDWKAKPAYGDKPRATGRPEWTPRDAKARTGSTSNVDDAKRGDRLEWKPKGSEPTERTPGSAPEKRKWIPKQDYKKSKGIEAPRDSKWRPGGEHRDPKQKYKDAKKAKWTSFKKAVRSKWEGKQSKKNEDK